jgi:hypothetical protein
MNSLTVVKSLLDGVNISNLNSWVVESSLDGENWIEIDRETNHFSLQWRLVASFPVWNSEECRFIRLTQTGKNSIRADFLGITAFEVFGPLIE